MEDMRSAPILGLIFMLSATCLVHAAPAAEQEWYRVNVPVADLRKEPGPPGSTLDHDPLEESQLLYGDRVLLLERKEGWGRIEAEGQEEWTHHKRWQGYPGWIRLSAIIPDDPNDSWLPNIVVTAKSGTVRKKPVDNTEIRFILSLGTYLAGINEEKRGWWKLRLLDDSEGWIRREEITLLNKLTEAQQDTETFRGRLVKTARLFLNDPYYWGGRSAYNPQVSAPPQRTVDCSGLIGLVYQANALEIPRDAHEQWMQARAIPPEKLSPGDLVFLHDPVDPQKVTHVMLYIGDGHVIEGPGTGQRVRRTLLSERLQKETRSRKISYGTYLEKPSAQNPEEPLGETESGSVNDVLFPDFND